MSRFTRIAAIVLLLLAVLIGVYAWLLSQKPPRAAPVAPSGVSGTGAATGPVAQAQHSVLVAAKALPAGEPITPEAVRLVQLPIQLAEAVTDVSKVVGRVPVSDLAENTPLTEALLVSGLALRLESGERAVAVKADEVMGVGNRIRPGDFVDVFFVLKSDNREVTHGQARLLLARSRVLAFGSASVDGDDEAGDASKAGGSSGAKGSGSSSRNSGQQRKDMARSAVLAVPVADVNRLTLADANARLILALRRPDDMQLPSPDYFATLPTALRPVPPKAGEAPRGPLEGMDAAQAGLTTSAWAQVDGSARTSLPSHMRTAPAAAPAPSRNVTRTPSAPAHNAQAVEVIRGSQRDTLHY